MIYRNRDRKMKFWAFLGSAIMLSVAMEMLGAVDAVDDSAVEKSYSLVRNRLKPSGTSFERSLRSNEGMGNIWEKASRIARSDIEALRLLNNADMMSMSLSSSNDNNGSTPTRPPTPKPTPKPISPSMPSAIPNPTDAPQSVPSSRPDLNPQQSPSFVDCSEGTLRNEYIFDRLKHITQPDILMDSTTPQGKAYAYLANDDPGITDHCSYSTLEQRYGLTTLFFATNGETWIDSSGWLGDEQECFWYGVDCDDIDDSNHLTRILLRK